VEPLALDPGSYGGTYKLVGGRASLDLINTVSWPDTERAHDWLDSPHNLQRWMHALGLPSVRCKTADLPAVSELRTELTAVLRPLAHGDKPPRRAIESLNRRIAQASSMRVIDPVTLAWTWRPPDHLLDAFAPVVMDAAELIATGSRDRLRHCPSCDWLFEDKTRNGQRRWCDMADCGSRDKSHRYYHRNRS
jgi:predicted RNA-binding Zn ribbon-like protein